MHDPGDTVRVDVQSNESKLEMVKNARKKIKTCQVRLRVQNSLVGHEITMHKRPGQ